MEYFWLCVTGHGGVTLGAISGACVSFLGAFPNLQHGHHEVSRFAMLWPSISPLEPDSHGLNPLKL